MKTVCARIGQLKYVDSAPASEDRGYTYDAAWNLNYRTNNTTLQTFSVDGLNQLTTAPEGATTYDANGNLTNSNGGALLYAYDDENQLSVVQSNTVAYNYTNTQVLYAYDGLGRLRLRIERYNTEALPGGGGEESLTFGPETMENVGGGGSIPMWGTNSITEYIYDGWRVVQERDINNTPTVSYTRGSDLSGTLQGAGGIGGLLARAHGYASTNGNWYTHNFYHADGNGNITYLVNSSQTLAASYKYDPYGNLISSSGTLASANTYRFSSKEYHANSGFYYYGYRWYAPTLQRWVNRDPIAEKGHLNLYSFTANNPASRYDLLGLTDCSDPCGDAKKKGLDKGNPAGTVCCDGKKYACVWDPGGDTNPTDPKAKEIIKKCLDTHEGEHLKDPNVKCRSDCLGLEMAKGNKETECRAYKAELSCLQSGIQDCAGNPECIAQVQAAVGTTQMGIKDNCKQ